VTDTSRAVFLSYASQDAAAAARIGDALRMAGIEVWFDRSELRGGDAWDQTIRRQIRDCALFIPVVSANTASRPEGYFRLEWSLAEQRSQMIARNKHFIVPVCLDDTPETGADVPESFQRVQWIRLPRGETTPAFAARIAALLSSTWTHGADAALNAPTAPGNRPQAPRRRIWVALGIAAVLALAIAVWQGWRHYEATGYGTPAGTPAPEKSIAVLPFVDLSERHDQEYFADGLAEEVLDLLAQVPDLHVPARSSSFYFKGKNERVATIARELGVAHVLEGSVRRSGDTLRVSVQLVRADTGYHLWSSIYERNVHEVFKVQDDIASAVVEALKARLVTPKAGLTARRTSNADAYDQYLRGRHLFQQGDLEGLKRAVVAYRGAAALDPKFAPAIAGLAITEYLVMADYDDEPRATVVREVLDLANRGVQLAPDLAEAYSTRAYIRMHALFDFAGAEEDLAKAAELDPTDAAVQRRTSFLMSAFGRPDAAVAAARHAVELDPLDPNSLDGLASALDAMGRGAEARDIWERTRAVSARFEEGLHGSVGWSYLLDGALADARRECAQGDGDTERACLAVLDWKDGRGDRARSSLARLAADHPARAAYAIASAYALIGNAGEAFAWLDRAYATHNRHVSHLKSDRTWAALRGDPRWTALMHKLNLPA